MLRRKRFQPTTDLNAALLLIKLRRGKYFAVAIGDNFRKVTEDQENFIICHLFQALTGEI